MRKYLYSVLMVCALVSFVACVSTPKRIAYTTLNSVALSVDAARGAYVDYYKQGNVGVDTHAKVTALDQKYTAAMLNAISLAQYNWSAPATQDVVALANELITTVNAVIKGKK